MKCIIATLAMACVPAMAQQAEPFTPQQLKTGADLYAPQLLAVPRRAHARPARGFRPEKIPARPARALRRRGNSRQEPDAGLGRSAQARRGRSPMGLCDQELSVLARLRSLP